jgi:hypothetical protein
VVSLELSLRNIVSRLLDQFQLKMTIVSPRVTVLLLIMLQESSSKYGHNEG